MNFVLHRNRRGVPGTLDGENVVPVESLKSDQTDTEAVFSPDGAGGVTVGSPVGSDGENLGEGEPVYGGRTGTAHKFKSLAGDSWVEPSSSDDTVTYTFNEATLIAFIEALGITIAEASEDAPSAKVLTGEDGVTVTVEDTAVVLRTDSEQIVESISDQVVTTVNAAPGKVVIEGDEGITVVESQTISLEDPSLNVTTLTLKGNSGRGNPHGDYLGAFLA